MKQDELHKSQSCESLNSSTKSLFECVTIFCKEKTIDPETLAVLNYYIHHEEKNMTWLKLVRKVELVLFSSEHSLRDRLKMLNSFEWCTELT